MAARGSASRGALVADARGEPLAALVAAGAVACGAVLGIALAVDLRLALGAALLALYATVIVLDPPFGVAVWMGLSFVADLGGIQTGLTAATPVFALVALATLAGRARRRDIVRGRAWWLLFAAMLGWSVLSLGWAARPGAASELLGQWARTAVLVLVVAVTVRTPRDARVVLAGLVAGPVLSVAVGFAYGGLGDTSAPVTTATAVEGRLVGGVGDPNFLAAGIVAAIVLAAVARSHVRAARWPLAATIGVLVVGLMATQSRGGALAAAVAWIAALAVMRGRRRGILVGGLLAVALAGAYVAANPAALDRLTSAGDEGNGRTELWTVAWRVARDHPLVGVGLDNFRVYAPEYVRRPGGLRYVELIADRPHVVHDTYLEALVETGVVGLGLLLAVLGVGVRETWSAARRFERRGEPELAELSKGVVVALLALLVAAVFLSIRADASLWGLLSVGVMLSAMARAR
jgi:O-antigen ligase